MTSSANPLLPTGQGERIQILDSLRGIAVLGILLMNIPGFAIPRAAIWDPTLMDFTGANYYTWWGVDGLLEGSQRAIFSMLFGAGMLLFINRLENRMPGLMPAELFFRRQLWLLLFGLINAYLLMWFWDILFCYALLGMFLFAFRRLSAKNLLIAAGVCLVLQMARENVDLYRDKATIARGEAVARIDTTKQALTPYQKDQLNAMNGMKQNMSKESKKKNMEKNIRDVQGSYPVMYRNVSEASFNGETRGMFYFLFFDVLLCMFIGMAFYKNGILTGKHPAKTYWWLFLGGLGLGLPISYLRITSLLDYNFDMYAHIKSVPVHFYEFSRILRSLGIFGGIMLLYKSGVFNWLFSLMRPVGQMAFTNYLMQSIVCGIFFYGVGFGMFGKLEFHQIYFVVAAVWLLEIVWSHIWLSYFRFGPLEWLWRSLTYWKIQPIRKKEPQPVIQEKEELVTA